jgi:hypothetical protein
MRLLRLVLGLLMVVAISFGGELVVNGGFETNDGYHSAPPWIFTAAAYNSDFFYGALEGDNVYDGFSAAQFGAGDVGYYDTISQVLATVPGDSYTFSFYLDVLNGAGSGEIALWNGTEVMSLFNVAQSYTFYSFSETATSATTTIAFEGYNTPSWSGLDDVSVQGASAIPEPASFALIAPALLGLAALRRKFGR